LVVKNYGDSIQAHYLAVAGIEKAKALLYADMLSRKKAAKNHTAALASAPDQFRDVSFGRGQFRIFRQGTRDEGGGIIYGITDEEARLNINTASAEELAKLYNITREAVAAIMDWRDQDNNVTPGGAEADYYGSLQPPYMPRNGPFETTRELLMVSGISRDLFLGEDANQNGLLDPEEDDGDISFPPDNRDGILDAGWSGMLTVDSLVRNINAAGENRVNIQSADENALTGIPGISAEIAKAIIAHRNQNRFESLADLLDVRAPVPQPQTGGQQAPKPNQQPTPQGGAQSQGQAPQSGAPPATPPPPQLTGPKLIDEDLLIRIADDVTISSEGTLAGPINLNTASVAVLMCLAGIDEHLAQAIVSYRDSAGYFPNIAGVLKVPGMNQQIFKQIASKVTARSETFRILSEGKVGSTGARKRIQVIVRLGPSDIQTLAYREDL
jgi:competence ComEA-like helix-hairpin-helix protein